MDFMGNNGMILVRSVAKSAMKRTSDLSGSYNYSM